MLNPTSFKAHSGRDGARLHRTGLPVIIQAVRPTISALSAARRPRVILALAALLALTLALAACGTGTATQTTATTRAVTTTTAGAVTTSSATTSAATQASAATGSSAAMPAITTAPAGMATAATTSAGQAGTTGGTINVKIDASKAREMIKSNPNAILLDVRTVEENREKRIPGSTLIPIQELPNRLNELPKDPNRPILVYCRSGNRSAQAAAILSKAGFPAVYDFGGIIDWPYETEQG